MSQRFAGKSKMCLTAEAPSEVIRFQWVTLAAPKPSPFCSLSMPSLGCDGGFFGSSLTEGPNGC